jgi:flagellar biosynthesis protein FliR
LDDAIKLGAAKRWVEGYLEDSEKFERFNEKLESIKALADQTGMIVLIGVPLITLLLLLAVVISCCCTKVPKCKAFGVKLKDKLVLGMIVQIGMVSSLAFAQQAGFGRAFN